ncbi:uncharacterized protein L969DRAFT_90378 [Mixia osmundae IAM 14324]|uniref:PB1 domain-containing protein n=1 Tax=Mixia osmundae (strain CBS 9802 / IAM 14324 / JCM 22182 / KY 12970) TaxID=764103 RepID=G7E2B0_MIXOS|nr:uncharacterized protein L969DRAFT_90378 [Mixia osmundae IAM 14324]KEI36843.1 hypothetical protein L969DRAFT_90378 [Mixia osmundae IAM 14324]GAA96970.1 hypothetical protein E5Q_03644 [Mixia osmundae IAM 14324]
MSLKAEIETWVAALDAHDQQDYDASLDHFATIAVSSKILFNIGIIHAALGAHDDAIAYFNRSIKLDPYLAISYYQAGVSHFLLGRYDAACVEFDLAYKYLRHNSTVDYTQLGLQFRLCSCEVLFNTALCLLATRREQEGMGMLRKAAMEKQTDDHAVIDEAISDGADGYTVFSVPVGVLFRPPEAKVKNLQTRDYLGKSKLVVASRNSDAFVGFSGVQKLAQLGGLSDLPVSEPPKISISSGPFAEPQKEYIDTPIERPFERRQEPLASSLQRRPTNNTESVTVPSRERLPIVKPLTISRPGSSSSLARSSEASRPPVRTRSRGQGSEPSISESDLIDSYQNDSGMVAPSDTPPINRIEEWAQTSGRGQFQDSDSGYSSVGSKTQPRPSLAVMTDLSPPNRSRMGLSAGPSDGRRGQDLFEDIDGQSQFGGASAVSANMSRIRLKLQYRKTTRGMSIDSYTDLGEIRKQLLHKFQSGPLALRYQDEDGDEIAIEDESDWESAIDAAREFAQGRPEGKLKLYLEDQRGS